MDAITGSEEEKNLLHFFPKPLYQICSVKEIGSFYVDSRMDLIKNELKAGHPWETCIVDLIKKHAQPGTVALDIGAHMGIHTISLASAVGENGMVIAFEPQLKLFSELVMNVLLNNCSNVIAYRCALGDESKSIEMSPAVAGNEGATAIGKGGDRAEMIPLDSLEVKNVSFIKIDVENFEYEVLKGAEKTIRENHPYIVIEIMGNTYQPIPDREQKVQRVLKLLEGWGYSLSYIQGSWSDWLATPLTRN